MPKKIMVINDTQEILELFHEILAPEGYDVVLYSYSTRDLDDVQRERPDLIISDHPPFEEQQGWQFIQKLRMNRATAAIPVIICTTSIKWVRANADEALLATRGITILPKPFIVDELLREVNEVLGPPDEPQTSPLSKMNQRRVAESEQSDPPG